MLHAIVLRKRLFAAALAASICYFVLPIGWTTEARVLFSWNVAAILYIALVVRTMASSTPETIKHRAELVDESRFQFLTLAITASLIALAAVVFELNSTHESQRVARYLHLFLAGFTCVTSWTFIHLVFAQHYAHEFFIERESEKAIQKSDRGGLRFPGDQQPLYIDFVYFAFVIGVACQTADVSITSRPMRGLNLIHCILSFFFNTTIIALSINIAASLLSEK